jgi:hypothetical protein
MRQSRSLLLTRLAPRQDPLGPVDEFRDMVKALHLGGIESFDVVITRPKATSEGQRFVV